ncbi:MAG: GreA/GreB family elongation factor [Lacunisphaera sp.]|nr:GreA/GreB family elongation factor [Lacunisphaera sp.]
MSKAFTKEDDTGDAPVLPRLVSPLPPGTRNYLTRAGERHLRGELNQLAEKRPVLLASAQTDAEAKRQLAALDQRLSYLQDSLRSAEVPPLPLPGDDRVRFGATVMVKEKDGTKTSYRIVGVDETDPDRNRVSWLSPIARALLSARLGQKVAFKFPSGQKELEIIRIDYEAEG